MAQIEMQITTDLKNRPDFQYRLGTFVLPILLVKMPTVQLVKLLIILFMDALKFGGLAAISVCGDRINSWEAETENNQYYVAGGYNIQVSLAESQILTNFEKVRVAISRLEKIVNLNLSVQNPEILTELLFFRSKS
uniref:Uncharacterized protein n=1 Tax=Glossina austeni TaxID=7395 RepID=A0A1A9VG22_GLOAU